MYCLKRPGNNQTPSFKIVFRGHYKEFANRVCLAKLFVIMVTVSAKVFPRSAAGLCCLPAACFACTSFGSLLPGKWCVHSWEITPEKFTLSWKQYHNRFSTYQRLVAAFLKGSLGRDFPPWLLNYHLYLFESWVFRNGLNQWNKKGRCLMVFRWVLKISSGIAKWCLRFLLQKLTPGSIPLLPTAYK